MIATVLLIGNGLNAQVNRTANKPATTLSDTTVEEKLVQLALQGPRYKYSEHKNKIDEYQLRKAKSSWLNLLSLSMNYNDQTLNKNAASTYVYPKYFFGFTIPLGIIFSNGIEVKAAREAIKASHTNQSQLAREIRSEVLSLYARYKTFSALLAIQNKVIDDEEATFQLAEKKLREATMSIELYNAASKNYNLELTKRLDLTLQQDLVKIKIEEMISVNLETVLSSYSSRK